MIFGGICACGTSGKKEEVKMGTKVEEIRARHEQWKDTYPDGSHQAWIDVGTLLGMLDAAQCFQFGDWCAEHIVDTDGKDWGWVVSKNGKWEQREAMGRDEAIAEAKRRAEKST
jgi:intein/homing endonuclease